MKQRLIALVVLSLFALATAWAGDAGDWRNILAERLPLYGHRNWIVVADSAYPAQSSPGIETVVSGADQISVLRTVLAAIQSSKHVRPVIYTDRELKFVSERDAPGIQNYRTDLAAVLRGAEVQSLPHEEIISKLDQASRMFKILIIKTNLTVPYTSVFIQLNAGYWSDEAERKLRAEMAQHATQ